MGLAIPQVITPSKASGAQIIDGSLKFDDSANQHLERTISASNRRTFTLSVWVKHSTTDSNDRLLGNYTDSTNYSSFYFRDTPDFQISFVERVSDTYNINAHSRRMARDTGWYHIVWAIDTTQSTDTDRVKLYVNGVQETLNESYSSGTLNTNAPTLPSQNYETRILAAYDLRVGARSGTDCWDGLMSQFYVIDGQALGPEYFGFTDPLTNTWKPKKYVNTTASHGDAAGVVGFGTNGFYLPMDGNSPIGEDKSGQGNNWTPTNFGGSVALDNPQVSGARPILNTTQGGTQAGVDVFGSKQNVGYAVTVYNDGGGNKYYIDGVKQATLTGLIRGATYTFDTSDSSNSGHPFRFSESDGGSEYTNGVAAITGTATTITIPYNSSNDLYYYCTNHSGMGSSITGITTNEKLADQYASDCIFATPFVGIKSDVSPSIACTSTATSLVDYGDPVGVTTNSVFYSGSFYYDGNDGHDLGVINGTALEIGSADFCIEGWFNGNTTLDASYWNPIITLPWHGQNNNESQIWIGFAGADNGASPAVSAGEFHARIRDSSGIKELETGLTTLYNDETWHHFAVTKNGTLAAIFVDGILKKTVVTEASLNTGLDDQKGYIAAYNNNTGSIGSPQGFYTGYLNDIRIYKGAAKYVGVTTGVQYFIPPSTSPDILPDTPSGVSGGSKLAKITDGAVAFDGTGDYLSLADNDDFDLGTGDFTFEAFFNQTLSHTNYRYIFSHYDGSNGHWLRTDGDGPGRVQFGSGGTVYINSTTNVVLNKWYHVAVVRVGTTVTLYLDGIRQGTYTLSGDITSTGEFRIGRQGSTNTHYFGGFISNLRINKGSAIYTGPRITPPTAPLTNVTNTKLLCCQSPTSATEGAVKPGTITANGDSAATNFNPFITDINTVRGQESGYCTLNPFNNNGGTLSNGNLSLTSSGAANVSATLQIPTTGKWYWEYLLDGLTSGGVLGISDGSAMRGTALSNWTKIYGYSPNGNKYENASASSYGATLTAGDLVGVKYDADTRQLEFLKNNNSQGVAYTVSSDYDYYPSIHGNIIEVIANFGQKPFKFAPPDGFQPLNTANARPVNVISRPDQYVGVTTYTGDNTASKKIDNLLFSPDLVWVKDRNLNFTHFLNDTVRGAGKILQSNVTTAETDNSDTAAAFPSFDPKGFTVGTNSNWQMNGNNEPYVGWCWKAGGSSSTFNVDGVGYATTTAAGLTAGDVSPTGASVGTKQGFSIIRWTAPTWNGGPQQVPHGLTQSPSFIIAKVINDAASWYCYHKDLDASNPQDKYIALNDTSAAGTLADSWGTSAPNSTTFGDRQLGWSGGQNVISYIWHDVPGLQKFGSYEGNQAADGPFVELGFQPAIIWLKNADDGTNRHWCVVDATRTKINKSAAEVLFLDDAQVESYANNNYGQFGTKPCVDILSNGFKVREGDTNAVYTQTNRSNTIIYCAWAAAPSIDLYGGGANAR